MKTKTITDTVLIRFVKFSESTLDIECTAETDNTYLNEHDGTKFNEFAPAFDEITDKDFNWCTNDRDEAWVNHWNDEVIDKFDGREFRVSRHQLTEVDEDGEIIDVVEESFKITELS